jgi:hypothetical protein
MVQGLRYLAYVILVISGPLLAVGLASFLIEIPGMKLNGHPVESLEDKVLFVALSLVFILGALGLVALLRKDILQRHQVIWRTAYWAETLPSVNARGRRWLAYATAALVILSSLLTPTLQPAERLVAVLGMPLAFALGFGAALFVLGMQVLNPFCPEVLLRAAALIFFAFFLLGILLSIPQPVVEFSVRPEALLMPPCALGVAYGAAYVLRRWTKFQPMIERPGHKHSAPDVV